MPREGTDLRVTAILTAFLVISVASLLGLTLWPTGPQLRVDGDVVDFGDLDSNEQANIVVDIHNEGDRELRIERVWVACSCASAYLENRIVPPHGKAPLNIRVTALGNGSNKEIAMIISSNDPAHPRKAMAICYNVKRSSRLAEREIYFGRIDRSELPQRKSILYTCNRQERSRLLETLSAESDLAFLRIRRKEPRSLQDVEIEVTLTEEAPDGELLADMWVRNESDSDSPQSSVKIMGYVRGNLVAVPSSITVGAREETVVSIQSRNPGEAVRVVNIELTNNMDDTVLVESERDDETQELHVSLKRDVSLSRGSRLLGTIIVSVRVDGRIGRVAVPVISRQD